MIASGLDLAAVAGAWHETRWIEIIAAALAILYLLLAIPQRLSCWWAAFASSCLYVWILFDARLYMESTLQAFYAAMAVYGYLQWRKQRDGSRLEPSRWPLAPHAAGLALVIIASCISWVFLRRFTAAAWPLVDSLVTWASVFATYLVARKSYENWYWWLAIDSVSVYLYFTRHLYVTMLLFVLYLILIVVGMREWRRHLPRLMHASVHAA